MAVVTPDVPGARHKHKPWNYGSGWGDPNQEVGHTGYDIYGWPIGGPRAQRERDIEAHQEGSLFRAPQVGRPPGYGGALPPSDRGTPNTSRVASNGSGANSAGAAAASHASGGTVQTIIDFFRSKGLNNYAIAGILGNWRVESSFSTTSYNGSEGAHGLANWEGGRWPALESFAASRGTSPYDLETQLEFTWHELTTSYSGVLSQLQNVNSAWDAANIWNRQYEVSGDYTNNRENYAQSYLQAGFKNVAGITIPGSGNLAGASGGNGLMNGLGTPSASDYKSALGDLSGLLQGIPELKSILDQAVSDGWSVTKFEQAIQGTSWYRDHNVATRELISLQFHDPQEYRSRLGVAAKNVTQTAAQLGVSLTRDEINHLAIRSITQSWDSQTLSNEIGQMWNSKDSLEGQAAALHQQLRSLYNNMGVPMSEAALNNRVQAVLDGSTTIDTYNQAALSAAKSMYPALAHQLDSGQTVKDIADPYIQTMGNLLEIDPTNIGLNNPMIKRALQGRTTVTNGKASATTTPIWQFENLVRSDPRWQYTKNAMSDVGNTLNFLGQSWGTEA